MAIPYHNINPIILPLGPLAVSWYSLSYVVGILLGWKYANLITDKYNLGITKKHFEQFINWIILGIIIGGRLGFVLFYDPIKYFKNPIAILKIYEGGMSFHGGIIGALVVTYIFSYINKLNFLTLCDVLSTISPIGLFLGRIANFINGELYGRITNVPWAMVFPYGGLLPRHPSQIYEALLEGVLLFIIMFVSVYCYRTILVRGITSAIFLISYSTFRSFVEFFREPHYEIGYFTAGQILSIPLFILGIYLIIQRKLFNR